MADAYQCDRCKDIRLGGPYDTLYREVYTDSDHAEYRVRAELCKDCAEDFVEFLSVGDA